MSVKAKVHSRTGAMKDVYESAEVTLDEYLAAFPFVANQKGLLVFINNKVAGLDMVSLTTAYSVLHQKLVKSYAMEAFLDGKKKPQEMEITEGMTRAFLDITMKCKEETYPSTGHGTDHRFEGRSVVGSALVYENTVIHMAFFTTTETEKTGHMSGLRTRRGYRVH